jgi:hypothetical protein
MLHNIAQDLAYFVVGSLVGFEKREELGVPDWFDVGLAFVQ